MFFGIYGDTGAAILFLALRVVVGFIFIAHAHHKLRNIASLAKGMRWSKGTVKLLAIIEVVAGLALILGIGVYIAALILGVIMIGALYYKAHKWKMGFTMTNGTGWEFDLLLLLVCLFISFASKGVIDTLWNLV